ncbi:hypothetical protein EDB87DRAFT_1827524 [Lactarius vividus]|nr:hypothetical protein EDB87DRAFT_1827524 [Lactarius vividus]
MATSSTSNNYWWTVHVDIGGMVTSLIVKFATQALPLHWQLYQTRESDSPDYRDAPASVTSVMVHVSGRLIIVPNASPGKTSFLYYVLLRRLSSKSPTALQLPDGCILFDEGGPQEFSRSPKHTVALADSVTASRELRVAFQDAAKAHVARVIQTMSPAPKNWSRWHKDVSANQKWSFSVCPNKNVLGLYCDMLQRIYNTWGPSTRNCVHLTRDPDQEGSYADKVEIAVRDFVRKFFDTYQPGKDRHEERSRLTARVATRRIERMILLYSVKAEAAEQISFYKMLSTHKWFGSPTGYMRKNYVLACLYAHPASKPLPCIAADSGPTSTLEIPVTVSSTHSAKPEGFEKVIICSAVFDVDRLGSIHERLIEICKKKGGDSKEEIIHGNDDEDDESDRVMLT